ncbi:MAG: ABC transporter permease [Methanosarcinales archaeon]|nr:ABC transporter permease [Methanosarcinales archaeon]
MALTITSVIKKDLKIYIRHRKTVLLIFLTPILIMILIGSMFTGGTDQGLKDIRLGVGGGSELGEEIIQELNDSQMFQITTENTTDPAVIEEGVRSGKYSAGIFIPMDETQAMKLYIDNSRVLIAPVISTVFMTTTEKMSYELTLGFLSRLWEELAQMEAKLYPLQEGVIAINSSIISLNSSTQEVISALDELNATSLNASVAEMNQTLGQMKVDLNQTAADINESRLEIRQLDENVSSIYNDAALLRNELKVVVDDIDSTDAALLDLQTGLQQTYDLTCTVDPSQPQCITLSGTIQQIKNTRSLLQEHTAPVISLYNSLDNVARTSAQLHDKLNRTDARLQEMQVSINNYTLEISNINENIADIKNVVTTLEDVKDQSANTSQQLENLSTGMANSTASLVSEIERTKGVINEVTTKSPNTIAAPVTMEMEKVFEDKSQLDFLMPGIISIVLMFISFMLASITIIQERTQKTLVRTLLTPLSLGEFIFAKTFALILIALMQGIIMIIVAFLLYGVLIPVSQWGALFLVILVYSASFIGIGMALATLADSENTAMLMSLVLSIPMLFLCGMFFPFETMPPLMAWLGNVLPITMGIRALDAVLIYQQGFDVLAGHLMPLLGYGIAGLGLAYVLLRREVMG